MTGYGKRGRPQTATSDERQFRLLLRNYGFRCEAVPFIRARYDGDMPEHTAVVCYPPDVVADIVEIFLHKHNRHIQVTRVRVPKETRYGQPACRVFLRWSTEEEMDADFDLKQEALALIEDEG